MSFDRWQQGLGQASLAYRSDGKYTCTVGGVVVSIPRQVGKTYTVGNLLIGLALEFPNTRIVWTSHHGRTTTNTFRAMVGMVRRKKIAPLLAPNGIRSANGEQEIRFGNGSIIMFGAREQGFGRGMDAIDFLVFDEAQILGLKALEDMVPAVNQARHPHGGLVFFMGTPPRPTDDGEAFTAKRRQALSGKAHHMLYVELSAPPGADSDDRDVWPEMNPSFPLRTPLESMLRMRENIPDEASWRREAMGIWDDGPGAKATISAPVWSALKLAAAPQPRVRALGVRFSLDGAAVAVAGASGSADRVFVEGITQDSTATGIDGLVSWIAERWRKYGAVVIDGKSGAGDLLQKLAKKGVPARVAFSPTAAEFITAHTTFLDAVKSGRLAHSDQPGLNAAVSSATQHLTARGWWWEPIGDGDTLLLEAATLALWGAETKAKPTAAPPRRIY